MALKTAVGMIAEAKMATENLSPAQMREEVESGDALLVNIRESEELSRKVLSPVQYIHPGV